MWEGAKTLAISRGARITLKVEIARHALGWNRQVIDSIRNPSA
jgi:hypothetical protein